VPDMAMLARRRARARAHVRRPTPPRLEDEAADVDLVEGDDLDDAVRKPPDLVGTAESLSLKPRHADGVPRRSPWILGATPRRPLQYGLHDRRAEQLRLRRPLADRAE